MNQQRLEERTAWVYDEQAFPVWNHSFDRSDRTEMIGDDLRAGRSIAMLLAALVAVGLTLALLTLAFVANWR
jgi:RecA-family ATPase